MTLACDYRMNVYLHLTPVYISLGSFPSRASLKTTGYLPAFVGSTIPVIVAGVIVLPLGNGYLMDG